MKPLTTEQIIENGYALIALAKREPIQIRDCNGEWSHTDTIEHVMQYEFRRAPEWSLPAPPEGRQWHRTDWTREMLPEGYRPLMEGEAEHAGDELALDGEGWVSIDICGPFRCPAHSVRTRRPLPPALRQWSKPEDVPGPVCWIRKSMCRTNGEWMILCLCISGARISSGTGRRITLISWVDLFSYEHSTDRKTWHPCTVSAK
jgi:hypothetical protein